MKHILYLPSLLIVLTFLAYENRESIGRWVVLVLMAAFLGIETGELIIMMPDWVTELRGIL